MAVQGLQSIYRVLHVAVQVISAVPPNYVFYCILTRSFVKIHLNLEYRGKSRAVLQMNKHALKFQANSNPLRIYLCGSRIIR